MPALKAGLAVLSASTCSSSSPAFLITSLILTEHARGTFWFLGDFMERRARRLVGAMVPVLVATWLAGYFLFLPDPFKDLSKSIVMLCLFAVNHYFLSATGGG